MGDPKKQKKKYRKPLMVWNEERIARDQGLIKNFGLKNKREIWKVESKLKSFHDQAKKLIAQETEQSKKEAEQLIKKLSSQSLISQDGKLDNVLSLTIQDLLNRRLQTVVFKKGFARTINQARQFITHNHIAVGSNVVNIPSYIVPLNEESLISFNQYSSLANIEHPERIQEEKIKIKEEILEKKLEKKEAKGDKAKKKPGRKKQEEELEEELPEGIKEHEEK